MGEHSLSRRSMLIGAGATAVTGVTDLAEPASASVIYDVIVIGAGAAGISAARTAKAYGRSVLVLEAQDYVGGRAKTDNTFPAPWDQGGQFFGDVVGGANSLYQIAKGLGLPTLTANAVPQGFLNGDAFAFAATYGTVLTALLAQGELVRDGVIPDLSVKSALSGLEQFPFFDAALALQLVQDGADPALASVLDTYNFASHSPAPFVYPINDTFFFPYGMGNFIQRLAKGLNIVTSAPVSSITYGGTGPVVISASGGRTYQARKVIVTVSTGVLRAKSITFSPALPAAYTNALIQLPMGGAYKAAMTFKSNIFKGRQGVVGTQMKSLVDLVDHPGQGLFVNYLGKPMAVFIGDAKTGDGYEKMTDDEAATFFLNTLETYFPGAKAAWTGKIGTTKWRTNPYTRGATSYATARHTTARVRLATPVDKKIWFAGEALSIAAHSQLHGAWQSGQAAAYGALGSLGAAVRAPA